MTVRKPCKVCGGSFVKADRHRWYCETCRVVKTRIGNKWKILQVVKKDYLAEVHGIQIPRYHYNPNTGRGIWR